MYWEAGAAPATAEAAMAGVVVRAGAAATGEAVEDLAETAKAAAYTPR